MGIAIPKEIEELGQLYEVEVSAIEFLAYNSHLIPVLEEMKPVLATYFPGLPVHLQLERDPETGRELGLWAMVQWTNGEHWRVASEALDGFDSQWWFKNGHRTNHLVSVDFRIPGSNP